MPCTRKLNKEQVSYLRCSSDTGALELDCSACWIPATTAPGVAAHQTLQPWSVTTCGHEVALISEVSHLSRCYRHLDIRELRTEGLERGCIGEQGCLSIPCSFAFPVSRFLGVILVPEYKADRRGSGNGTISSKLPFIFVFMHILQYYSWLCFFSHLIHFQFSYSSSLFL